MARRKKDGPDVSGAVACDACSSLCCRYVATQIDRPATKRDYDHIRWYLLHRGVHVFIDHDGDWYLEFETPCASLLADGRCGSYAVRPRICRGHGEGEETCEFHGGEPCRRRFSTAAAFERYLDGRGIDWRWRPRGRQGAELSSSR